MSDEKTNIVHNIIMEQCKRVNMTGIKEVKAFDEETVVLDTANGTLTVRGESLVIGSFSTTTGELSMEGTVWGLVYSGDGQGKGFMKRLFK